MAIIFTPPRRGPKNGKHPAAQGAPPLIARTGLPGGSRGTPVRPSAGGPLVRASRMPMQMGALATTSLTPPPNLPVGLFRGTPAPVNAQSMLAPPAPTTPAAQQAAMASALAAPVNYMTTAQQAQMRSFDPLRQSLRTDFAPQLGRGTQPGEFHPARRSGDIIMTFARGPYNSVSPYLPALSGGIEGATNMPQPYESRLGRGPTVSDLQAMGIDTHSPARNYVANATSIAASGIQSVQLTFATSAAVLGIVGACQVNTYGSASADFRDSFLFQISRTTGDRIWTAPLLGTAGAGSPQRPAWLASPWIVGAGETLIVDFTNLAPATTIVPTIVLLCQESS